MKKEKPNHSAKIDDLSKNFISNDGKTFVSEHGIPVHDSHNSLKAGERGPSLLEDFLLREKLAHFDRERIPERVVHARAAAAHGVFTLQKDMSEYTSADFLNGVGKETPVFVRLSTVAGFKGSTDLARDVRGFAVKFYTNQGNFDLVGNNIPVFFIQDAMKFPDVVHAVKPEPDNEMPQAASAHDTFWDFVSLSPEASHMIMWTMSDRAIPRSLRMMEGFGVHTFKLVNKKGKAHFVKFHWKPVLGVHSVCWDEAQKISGKNSDFHREDLWENIEKGNFPEWEFGVQIIPEEDEFKFDFDILDPTKLIPEELVPVEIIGKMTLNRNPDNFFAENEQSAFSPGNIVPGIDFSNDPLLQGRIFSYHDTQMHRLGGANFTQLPINRPLNDAHNTLRDGFAQHRIYKEKSHYTPNSVAGGCPFLAKATEGGFISHGEKIDAHIIRGRSDSFRDHYSQAKMFFNSQSTYEKNHIKDAFSFELSKVKSPAIRERVVQQLSNISLDLSSYVAEKLGLEAPKEAVPVDNHVHNADQSPADVASVIKEPATKKSDALSMANTKKDSIKSRKIAVFVTDGFDAGSFAELNNELEKEGAEACPIAPKLGKVKDSEGKEFEVKDTYFNTASVLFDAVYIVGGEQNFKAVSEISNAVEFANDAIKHCKVIGGCNGSEMFYSKAPLFAKAGKDDKAFILTSDVKKFINTLKQHRNWDREPKLK